MQRIYIDTVFLGDEQIIINDKEIYFQLTKVLRSKVKDLVIFFDGKIFIDFVYEIISIDKKNIIFKFNQKIDKNNSQKIINLYQSMPNKIDKIEDILQKGTEVGYDQFIFFRANRSQELIISENKIVRFNKIILEACEQSGRNKIPKLTFIKSINFSEINGEKYYFHTDINNSKKLNELFLNKNNLNLFIGPEGGFDDIEIQKFDENNFTKINLGSNILRTQTASIVLGFYFNQI